MFDYKNGNWKLAGRMKGIAWNFEQNLPYPNGHGSMAAISLPDTVILLGKFLKLLYVYLIILVGLVKKLYPPINIIIWRGQPCRQFYNSTGIELINLPFIGTFLKLQEC